MGTAPVTTVPTAVALTTAATLLGQVLRASLSLGWMFLVAAELIASTQGLGYLLSDGRETGRVDLVFIAIIALALLGKLSDSLLRLVEHHILAWRDIADLQETHS